MQHRQAEIEIARKLCSGDGSDRRSAVGAFVRLFACSAPAELALLAAESPEACKSFSGDRPLALHLIESLPLPSEVALAWRIALLEGEDLRRAVEDFSATHRESVCRTLSPRDLDADDIWQDLLMQTMKSPQFRRTCFGKFSGKGSLAAYLRATLSHESSRRAADRGRAKCDSDLVESRPDSGGASPDDDLQRRELRAGLAAVLGKLSGDTGFVAFLLQHGMDLGPQEAAGILGLSTNTVRQRTFRFRERFRKAWKELFPDDEEPFAAGEVED